MNADGRAPAGIAVTHAGQGARRAVLAHCALAHAGAWRRLSARLDDALSMTAFDLPGHGRSAPWDGQGDYQERAVRIAESLCDGPADLIGHSFGATVMLRLALERPDLCRTLTLIEPVFFAAAAGTPEGTEAEREFAPYRAALDAGQPETAARIFHDLWGGPPGWSELPETGRRAMSERIHLVEAGSAGIHGDSGDMLAAGRLEALEAPVLIVDGSESRPVLDAIVRALMARLPDARRVTVEGAGHMVPLTHPDAVANAIRARFSL
ncbi:alpha/beta fold hydrolase [Tranquillimonas alkanivorans]|uniref:Pimeloyl-ACP methyl ester carboxylesterase n=1 Tax=Tranquillimonas alkanivorans TaxID=441119 RepID=A0A1I5NCC8_9RHOB|nr:alpha/beta hydrolase [Tranquillimonas alkanivorans]SFP19444.1 Pimeloyl-ACP methyl ester carboxylesterase [Tranquillimonas alkanivorans]